MTEDEVLLELLGVCEELCTRRAPMDADLATGHGALLRTRLNSLKLGAASAVLPGEAAFPPTFRATARVVRRGDNNGGSGVGCGSGGGSSINNAKHGGGSSDECSRGGAAGHEGGEHAQWELARSSGDGAGFGPPSSSLASVTGAATTATAGDEGEEHRVEGVAINPARWFGWPTSTLLQAQSSFSGALEEVVRMAALVQRAQVLCARLQEQGASKLTDDT